MPPTHPALRGAPRTSSPPRTAFRAAALTSTLLLFGGVTGGFDATAAGAGITLHVASDGNDAWSGRLPRPNAGRSDGPLATWLHARDAVRALRSDGKLPAGGVEVRFQAGTYALAAPIQLQGEDGGEPGAPVIYRADDGAEVRISGGVAVTNLTALDDAGRLARLEPGARGHVLQADLRALGLTDFGSAGGGGLELFFADQPMPVSRWPNTGFVRIAEVLGSTPVDVRGTKGCVEGVFRYEGNRPERWQGETDPWLHGYWFWDWSDQRQRLKSIDAEHHRLELEPPFHNYGYRKGQWFYAYNLFSEIDEPGEWQLDRTSGRLYFWPPEPSAGRRVVVSRLPQLLRISAASHVVLRGFTFEAARETAIQIEGGATNRILACVVRNVGGAAIAIAGGAGHEIVGCDISACGAGGVSLQGGDRRTLQPAGHRADNNHIHHYGRWRPMYSAGISLQGVGLVATHNLIDNAPHQAIGFGGNDHRIEFNEIHSVCHESNDAGAIYAGRDWTMRGTVIRHNYLHDITGFEDRGCVGIYLDDMYCGTDIIGNVFRRVTSAAFIGGGRDCRIENNVFLDCQPAVHVDARALGWARYHADEWIKEGREKGTVSGTAYNQPPYATRYPALVNLLAEDPAAPRGNVIARNICVGGKWDDFEAAARPLLTLRDNLVGMDPRFVDAAAGNLDLRDDSPAFALGFQRIPVRSIGLYADPLRASWPVTHAVRPPHHSRASEGR